MSVMKNSDNLLLQKDLSEKQDNARIVVRPTGFLSFWNKYVPVTVLCQRDILIIRENSSVSSAKYVTYKENVFHLADLSYDVRKVFDLSQTLSIIRVSSLNEEVLIEIQFETEELFEIWIKYLKRRQLVAQQKSAALFGSTELLASLGVQKSSTTVATGVRQWAEVRHYNIGQYASLFVIMKRVVRKQREFRRGAAIIAIQTFYRSRRGRSDYLLKREAVVTIQSVYRMHRAQNIRRQLKQEKIINKLQEYRTRIVMEIFATESSYVEQLSSAIKVYLKPMRALDKKLGITQDQISAIFSNMEEIARYHTEFLAKFDAIVSNWSADTMISGLFVEMLSWLQIYIPYCNNFENAKSTLQKIMKNTAVSQFFETVENVKTLRKLDIGSFLILPVQRIPRYELLLKDLLKHTWDSHADHKELESTLFRLHEFAKLLNRAKSFAQSKEKIVKLQSHMGSLSLSKLSSSGSQNIVSSSPAPLQTAGSNSKLLEDSELEQRYIGEGFLTHVELERKIASVPKPKSSLDVLDIDAMLLGEDEDESLYEYRPLGVQQSVYAFLFNDMLVLTKRSKTSEIVKAIGNKANQTFKYNHHANVSLDGCEIIDYSIDTTIKKETDKSFTIKTSNEKFHKLTAETMEQKRKWISDISEALVSPGRTLGDSRDLLSDHAYQKGSTDTFSTTSSATDIDSIQSIETKTSAKLEMSPICSDSTSHGKVSSPETRNLRSLFKSDVAGEKKSGHKLSKSQSSASADS